jgi:hypothetical protein
VHLVGFITKKFVTMHGHMNVEDCVLCEVQTEFLYTIYMYISLQTAFNFMRLLPGGKEGES